MIYTKSTLFTMSRLKNVLGIWIVKNERSKFCLSVFNELKNRGFSEECIDGNGRCHGRLPHILLQPLQLDLAGS